MARVGYRLDGTLVVEHREGESLQICVLHGVLRLDVDGRLLLSTAVGFWEIVPVTRTERCGAGRGNLYVNPTRKGQLLIKFSSVCCRYIPQWSL